MPSSDTVPRFYGSPKVHKPACPLRPIVSSIGSVTYQVAKFVADIISPLAGQSPHHFKNSANFVERVRNLTLQQGEVMVSYDVTGLFTNTLVPDALRIIERRLEEDVTLHERTTLSVEDIMEILTLCPTSTYMMGLGQIYQQKEGFAMGSPVSPLASNIYMEWFETHALATAPHSLSVWARYVDDTYVVIRERRVHLRIYHPQQHRSHHQIYYGTGRQ